MFGHHEPAQATVLFAQDVSGAWEDVSHVKIEFVLEVHPPNGQTFRAQATHHFIKFTHYPQVGDVIKVKYHPKNREVVLDLQDDVRYGVKRLKQQEQAERKAGQARRDALLSAPPGTAFQAGAAGMSNLDPELQALMDLEEAERRAARGDGQR